MLNKIVGLKEYSIVGKYLFMYYRIKEKNNGNKNLKYTYKTKKWKQTPKREIEKRNKQRKKKVK
jgi:L-rhamnose mutarotase